MSVRGLWFLPAVDAPTSIMTTGVPPCHCLPTCFVGPWSTQPLRELWQPLFQRIGAANKPGPPDWHLHGVDVSTYLQIGPLNARFSAPVASYIICSTGIAQLKGLASGTSLFSDVAPDFYFDSHPFLLVLSCRFSQHPGGNVYSQHFR